MLLFLSILTLKNLDTMFSTNYQIKVVTTIKLQCQILNDEKL